MKPPTIGALVLASAVLFPAYAQDAPPATPDAAPAKVTLRLRLEKGAVYRLELHKVVKSHQILDGKEPSPLVLDVTYEIDVEVLEDAGDAGYRLELRFPRIHGKSIHPVKGETAFDDRAGEKWSRRKETLLVGKSIHVEVAKSGRLVKVEGLRKVLADVYGARQGILDSQETLYRRYLQDVFVRMPDIAVAVGDTWGADPGFVSGPVHLGAPAEYVLRSLDDHEVALEYAGRLVLDPRRTQRGGEATRLQLEKAEIKSSSRAGNVRVSRKDGLPNEGAAELSLEVAVDTPLGALTISHAETTEIRRRKKPAKTAF